MRKVKQAAALPCKADTLKNKFPIHTFQNVKNKLISLIWARANNIEGPAHIMKYEFWIDKYKKFQHSNKYEAANFLSYHKFLFLDYE